MAELQEVPERQVSHLVLEFDNAAPFRARDLADLFAALARDYRQINPGRELIVTEIRTGTLLASFQDALEIMASINTVVDFGKLIANTISLVRHAQNIFSNDRKPSAARTVEALLETAVNSKSDVTFRYESPTGETLLAKVSRSEARRLADTTKRLKKSKRKIRVGNEESILEDHRSILSTIADGQYDASVLRTIAKIMLQRDMHTVLQSILDELKKQGRTEAARVLADEINNARHHRA